jgi:hypothetical protein
MHHLLGFICVCALGALPLAGCGDGTDSGGMAGDGGSGGTGASVATVAQAESAALVA